jgi:polar amino acid transport system permease protein
VAFAVLTPIIASVLYGNGPVAVGLLELLGLGEAWAGTWLARLLLAAPLAAALVLNTVLLARLPRRLQIGIVWAELLILFLAFFYSFNLDFGFIWARLGILVGIGAFTTIYVSLLSIAVASVIALAAALGRLSDSPTAYGLSTFYTSFFRGTPLLLQVYLIYLGLPQLGVTLDPVPSGVIALSLCYGAYMAEIFRAGIQSIPRGQWEAGYALGLTKGLIMRKIVLPQAIRVVVPPTGNQFIAMLKDSSLVSILGVWELMFLARTQGRTEFKHFEMLITAALIYWFLSFVFELVQARIEHHFGKADRR